MIASEAHTSRLSLAVMRDQKRLSYCVAFSHFGCCIDSESLGDEDQIWVAPPCWITLIVVDNVWMAGLMVVQLTTTGCWRRCPDHFGVESTIESSLGAGTVRAFLRGRVLGVVPKNLRSPRLPACKDRLPSGSFPV